VRYIADAETSDALYCALELSTPLPAVLDPSAPESLDPQAYPDAVLWGLFQVASGLSFLNHECGLLHGSIQQAAVMVTPGGDWKLSGFETAIEASNAAALDLSGLPSYPAAFRPPEGSSSSGPLWSTDMFGLGCMIYELYTNALSGHDDLASKSQCGVPASIKSIWAKMVSKTPQSRPDPRQVVAAPNWRKSPYVTSQLFFDNAALSEDAEKEKFYRELAGNLTLFPISVAHHKVLPHLCVMAAISAKEALLVLSPLLVIGKTLDADGFKKQVEPVVVKLFGNPDRALRVTLLQHLESFVVNLSPELTADTIYPQVAQGFSDNHAMLRELSVKACLHLVPKMNEASGGISEAKSTDVAKQLGVRLSTDQEPIIRTNTIVCLSKISVCLTTKTREKLVLQGLMKGTKDRFKHARGAAAMALAAVQELFPTPLVATAMLPAICPLTADPDREVNDSGPALLCSERS